MSRLSLVLIRTFDIFSSLIGIIFSLPLVIFGSILIRLADTGSVFYSTTRIGIYGKPFKLYKLRTMYQSIISGSPITAPNDNRIIPYGSLLRASKIDELPQLLNILRGDMSVVGPRPESQSIVCNYYSSWMRETLKRKPGLTSPGTIFATVYFEDVIDPNSPEQSYIEKLMPIKLALDLSYAASSSLVTDIRCILTTLLSIYLLHAGHKRCFIHESLLINSKQYIPSSLHKYVDLAR